MFGFGRELYTLSEWDQYIRKNVYHLQARYTHPSISIQIKTHCLTRHILLLFQKHLLPFSKGFDTVSARLQMQTDVVIQDFVYDIDRHGKPYGWGVARYTTPENSRGPAFTDRVYLRKPEESYAILFAKLKSIFPEESDQTIARFLNYKDRHLKKSPADRILL